MLCLGPTVACGTRTRPTCAPHLHTTAGRGGFRPPSRSGRRGDRPPRTPEAPGQTFAFSRTHAPIWAMAASPSGTRPAQGGTGDIRSRSRAVRRPAAHGHRRRPPCNGHPDRRAPARTGHCGHRVVGEGAGVHPRGFDRSTGLEPDHEDGHLNPTATSRLATRTHSRVRTGSPAAHSGVIQPRLSLLLYTQHVASWTADQPGRTRPTGTRGTCAMNRIHHRKPHMEGRPT